MFAASDHLARRISFFIWSEMIYYFLLLLCNSLWHWLMPMLTRKRTRLSLFHGWKQISEQGKLHGGLKFSQNSFLVPSYIASFCLCLDISINILFHRMILNCVEKTRCRVANTTMAIYQFSFFFFCVIQLFLTMYLDQIIMVQMGKIWFYL